MLNPAPAHFDPDPPALARRRRPGSDSFGAETGPVPVDFPGKRRHGSPASRRPAGLPGDERDPQALRAAALRGAGRFPSSGAEQAVPAAGSAGRRAVARSGASSTGIRRKTPAGGEGGTPVVCGPSSRANPVEPRRGRERAGVLPVTTGHASLAAGDPDSHDSRLAAPRSEVDDLRFLFERYFPGLRARAGRLRRNGWSPRGEGFGSEIPSFFGGNRYFILPIRGSMQHFD